MIVQSKKFPFKWMPQIIAALEKNESIKISEVSREIGSCLLDGNESIRMLSYLTSFGKIELKDDKWNLLRCTVKNTETKKFRFRYISDLDRIIHLLEKEPLSTLDIAKKISKDEYEVLKALDFLSLITKTGYIESNGSGRNSEWRIIKWTN